MRLPPEDLVPLLGPTVERVRTAEGADFVRELRHLVVEGWLRNGRVEPFLRAMIAERAQRRQAFLARLRAEIREGLQLAKGGMLLAHPELADPAEFSEIRGRPHADYSPARFDAISGLDDVSREEYAPAVRNPLDPYDDERSVEGYLLAILSEWETELRKRDGRWGRAGRSRELEELLQDLRGAYEALVRDYVDWRLVAPEGAMLELCLSLRALNWAPELDGLGLDREDVLEAGSRVEISHPLGRLLYEPGGLTREEERRALEEVGDLKRRLDRAWDGLRLRFASTLRAQVVVERYKTRVEEHDRERARAIARRETRCVAIAKKRCRRVKSRLEDLLTRDLYLYLFDEGHRVLYRPRLDDLEPDTLSVGSPLGPRPILVEAKAYAKSGSARADIRNGFAQCLSYLNALSSSASAGVYEAHLVVFRLGGPLYGLPSAFRHGDFTVYPVLIDLADPAERGRDQAKARVTPITEDEIRYHLYDEATPEATSATDADAAI